MKKIFIFLSIIFSAVVSAGRYPETTVGNLTKSFQAPRQDRSVQSPIYNIFTNHVAGYSLSHNLYDRIVFLCTSSSNPVNGACPTVGTSGIQYGTTTITLQFTEKRSLIKRNINLAGNKKPIWENQSCDTSNLMVLNSKSWSCGAYGNANGTLLNLYIPAGEINKLPFGGIWEATLILRLSRYGEVSSTHYGNYTVNITVDLTDKGNIQVWLPGFHSNPRVDLNLHPIGNYKYSGSNSLDMCFYDGYSTNSDSMVIKFQDDNPTYSSEYNLYKIGGTEKLPYAVSLLMGEKIFYPVNGQSFTINDSSVLETNWNRVTAVAMPEVNVPVLCWPARLLLNADVNAPDAGQYSGQIYITFTPSVENL